MFGQTDVSATAVGNNTDSQGGAVLNAWQLRGGDDATRAIARANVGYGDVVNATSVASANNLSAAHAGSIPNLTAAQENRAKVVARTRLAVGEAGGAYASADGMGNNTFAGVYAPDSELKLDLNQDNSGEITVSTDFDGGAGSDASVRASAMGNTVVGFACTNCDATLDATSQQTNSGAVTATTRANSGAGTTSVTVQAIGNKRSIR